MTKSVDYQTLSAELEEILAKLQSGELDVDAALPAYERGMELVKQLEEYLKTAENKVSQLKAKPAK
ncbi:MAG TPA: exodeoxyribonuclease VII small subunit [Candidatus Saccharimonadales bacterium]|nr:exodeoxyribonuclease VII small subunit [Candidatus Saccharimonadales bacterium]